MSELTDKVKEMNKELAGAIIDVFDDFLEERNVRIPTSYEEMINDGRTMEDCGTRIYGSDYYELEDEIIVLLKGLEQSVLGGVAKQLLCLSEQDEE